MTNKYIIWIDDEPNLVGAEQFELELEHAVKTEDFANPMAALNKLLTDENFTLGARAIVIDVLMPSHGDGRLRGEKHHSVGQLFCHFLLNNFSDWERIKDWITLYSRSPDNETIKNARIFAKEHGIQFCEKNESSSIAKYLIKHERIRL